jgi:hypothetical protein
MNRTAMDLSSPIHAERTCLPLSVPSREQVFGGSLKDSRSSTRSKLIIVSATNRQQASFDGAGGGGWFVPPAPS